MLKRKTFQIRYHRIGQNSHVQPSPYTSFSAEDNSIAPFQSAHGNQSSRCDFRYNLRVIQKIYSQSEIWSAKVLAKQICRGNYFVAIPFSGTSRRLPAAWTQCSFCLIAKISSANDDQNQCSTSFRVINALKRTEAELRPLYKRQWNKHWRKSISKARNC